MHRCTHKHIYSVIRIFTSFSEWHPFPLPHCSLSLEFSSSQSFFKTYLTSQFLWEAFPEQPIRGVSSITSVCSLQCGYLWHPMGRPAPNQWGIRTRLQMETPGPWFALSFLPIHRSIMAEGSHTYTWTLQPLHPSSTHHPFLRLLALAMHSPGRVHEVKAVCSRELDAEGGQAIPEELLELLGQKFCRLLDKGWGQCALGGSCVIGPGTPALWLEWSFIYTRCSEGDNLPDRGGATCLPPSPCT